MAIETLPEPSIPITTPFRPRLGFLTATPIIAVATHLPRAGRSLLAILAPLACRRTIRCCWRRRSG